MRGLRSEDCAAGVPYQCRVTQLGVGIHGAGNVSTQYIEAFTHNPHTAVRMITSRTAEAARQRAAAYGLDCGCGDRLDDILARPDVDIVVICTPNHLHAQEAIHAARAGKHLVVEKPVALTLPDLRALVAAVGESRVKATVGFVLRWNPMVRMARRLAEDGTLGDLVLAEADYIHRVDPARPGWEWKGRAATSGGALMMGGCHAVDALRFCAGEIVSVGAYAAQVARHDFEYPPTVTASLRFAGGAVGKVSVTFEAHSPYLFNPTSTAAAAASGTTGCSRRRWKASGATPRSRRCCRTARTSRTTRFRRKSTISSKRFAKTGRRSPRWTTPPAATKSASPSTGPGRRDARSRCRSSWSNRTQRVKIIGGESRAPGECRRGRRKDDTDGPNSFA